MPNVDVSFEGLDTLQAILRETPTNGRAFIDSHIFDIATEAFNESQKQVPVRYGALRGSGTLTVASEDPFEVDIGYGGSAAGYALWVHENLAAHHKAPTKAKYLEDPVNAVMGPGSDLTAAEVEGAILGQYPMATGSALTGEMGGMARIARRSRIGHRTRTIRKMSDAEIHQAITAIDHGQELRRAGKRSIRTFHRKRTGQ